MNFLFKLRFWVSLFVISIFNFYLFWLFVPPFFLSGNFGADGLGVKGFPLITGTFGGCAMGTVNTCTGLNMLHVWINFVVLIIASALMAYVVSRHKSFWAGAKELGYYLLGWLITVSVFVLICSVLNIENIVELPPRWLERWVGLIVSIVYNFYYFFRADEFYFTLTKLN
jgi:hypothetical protein